MQHLRIIPSFSLLFLAGLLGAQEGWTVAKPERDPLAQLDGVEESEWKDLRTLLSDVRERTGVPAIGAAFVRSDAILGSATVGVRSAATDESVTSTDPFHLGSVTKSMTACVVAKLIEQGRLGWETRVRDVLTAVSPDCPYGDATVEQLLQHRAGLPSYTTERPSDHPAGDYVGSPEEQRAGFLADVLETRPVGPTGRMVYSNAGYVLVGHMAELVAGASWEELIQRHLFEPLAMRTAGVGLPDQPQGHVWRDGYVPVPRDAYPTRPYISPAGNVHSSVSDLADYLRAHLAGLNGTDSFLKAETVRRLHRSPDGPTGYACGWQIGLDQSGRRVHEHGGTVGASFALVQLYPDENAAALVLVTVEQALGEPLARRVLRMLSQRYRPALAGFSGGAGSSIEIATEEPDPEADERLWKVVGKLSRAINDEDREAYHDLFAKDGQRADRDSMFDFMARQVMPTRGGVREFHELGAPLRLGGQGEPMRLVTFHLDGGNPGYFGLALAEDDRIEQLSLFIKGDLCPHGTVSDCELSVRWLEEDFE